MFWSVNCTRTANAVWNGVLTREIFFLSRRGPIIVTELTTTPTLSAIVEFKNKESLDKVKKSLLTFLFLLRIIIVANFRVTVPRLGVPNEHFYI